RAGGICIDLLRREVTAGGRTVSLSAREFSLLKAFAGHPGQVLSRQELLSMAWSMNFDPQTNLVDVYVSYLRRKLGETIIETGSGYTRARPQSLVILAAFRFLPPSRLLRSWTQAHGFEPRRYRVWPWTSSQRRSPPTSPSGPAPTPRVSLRPPAGFAASSPIS